MRGLHNWQNCLRRSYCCWVFRGGDVVGHWKANCAGTGDCPEGGNSSLRLCRWKNNRRIWQHQLTVGMTASVWREMAQKYCEIRNLESKLCNRYTLTTSPILFLANSILMPPLSDDTRKNPWSRLRASAANRMSWKQRVSQGVSKLYCNTQFAEVN